MARSHLLSGHGPHADNLITGMNYQAQPLQPHEISKMKADPNVIKRLLTSYRLMLDFYGMQLVSDDTGLIVRSPNHAARYRNLLRK